MSLSDDFNRAVQIVRDELKEDPGTDTKLRIYALFKQSTVGPCTETKPGIFSVTRRRKWEAWSALGDMSKTDAMTKYCDLVSTLR